MDIEFHYWVTGVVAYRAGFSEDEARVIAYSSQYVDDNDVNLSITNKTTGKVYRNFISQTMNILKPKNDLMRIYPIFHFVPGDPLYTGARRRDGKMHILNTTPDNENANEFLSEAFKSPEDSRLYRIGVASHAYVDTWAHQNFIGWYDNFNALGNVLPNIGHADALHHPDWIGHRWDDPRLVEGDINNNLRFLSAAERLFIHYRDFLVSRKRYGEDERPDWNQVKEELATTFGSTRSGDQDYGKEERITRFKELVPWLPEYSEITWFKDAIETEIRGLKDSPDGMLSRFTIFKDNHYWCEDKNPESTDWFKFQEAAKEHERFALKVLSPLYKQMGVDIRKA